MRVHLEVRLRLERMLWVPLLGGQLEVHLVHLVHSHSSIGVLQF